MFNNSEIDTLLHEYERLFVQRAYAISGNLEDARDIVQDSLIKYIKFRKAGNEVKNPKSWIMMVIRNGSIDFKRKQQNKNKLAKQSIESDAELAVTAKEVLPPDKKMERAENIELGAKLLNQLNEKEQNLIKMKVYQGCSYKEIAQAHKMSVSNVGVTIHNAMKKMRRNFVFMKEKENEQL